jgi:FdhD protein
MWVLMKHSSKLSGVKYVNSEKSLVDDMLLEESPLQIVINKTPFTTTLRTPGSDLLLTRGLLYSENIFTGKNDQFHFYSTSENCVDTIHLELDGIEIKERRQLVSISSCGLCGVESFEYPEISPITNDIQINSETVYTLFSLLSSKQSLFDITGGSHACGLFDKNENMLSIQEDIGRHNATDKCIGELLEQDILDEAKVMLVSGRISYEIVHKCFRANIPILAAVSSPSALAVRMAEKMGITLIGFSRENRFTCYSHSDRIL